MTELPNVSPLPWFTTDDMRSLLIGLAPGRYTTRDLWPRYQAWATSQGRDTVSRNAFGLALSRVLGAPVGWAHGHVKVYEWKPGS